MEQYASKNMSTQPDSIRQNIIDWCQDDNIQCVDTSAENTQFAWSLRLGNTAITIYKQPHLPDRIFIQSQIVLSEIHRTLVNQTWDTNQRNNMMFNLKKLVVGYNINMDFQLRGDELLGFNTHKIHFNSTISKAGLLEKFIRVQSIHEVILNQLNIELGLALQSDRTNRNSNDVDTGR